MTTYKYKGVSKEGANISGVIRAYDEFEAVSYLRDTCSIITKIEPITDAAQGKAKNFKISDKDISMLCSQFSIILSEGMPIVRSVEMVAEQSTDKELRERLLHVAEDVEGGYTLAQSFEDNIPSLPTTFIETIRAGEQSGTLESCFARLKVYFERSSKVRARVVGALTYPLIVIVVALVVIFIIMTVAVPMFTKTFAESGTELPAITKGLIAISNFFVQKWWILVLIIAVCVGAYLLYRRTENGKRNLAKFSLNISPLRRIRLMNCSTQFASTMSTMIAAGLPIVRALEVTAAVVDNYIFSLSVSQVREDVEQGNGIAKSMRLHPCFPKLLTEICGVGERTGGMEKSLDTIGEFYSNEVQIATDKLLAVMEPAITMGLAGMTLLLLLAVYLPMFSMYGTVG